VPGDTDYDAVAAAIADWINNEIADFSAEGVDGEPAFIISWHEAGAEGNNKGVFYVVGEQDAQTFWLSGGLNFGYYPFEPVLGPVVAVDESWVYIDNGAVTRFLGGEDGALRGIILPASDGTGRGQNATTELALNPQIADATPNGYPITILGLSTIGADENDLGWVQRGFIYEPS
jgi:hypothetical protein